MSPPFSYTATLLVLLPSPPHHPMSKSVCNLSLTTKETSVILVFRKHANRQGSGMKEPVSNATERNLGSHAWTSRDEGLSLDHSEQERSMQ